MRVAAAVRRLEPQRKAPAFTGLNRGPGAWLLRSVAAGRRVGARAPARAIAVPGHVDAPWQHRGLAGALGRLGPQGEAQHAFEGLRHVIHHTGHAQVLPLQRRLQRVAGKQAGPQAGGRKGQGTQQQTGRQQVQGGRGTSAPPGLAKCLCPCPPGQQPRRERQARIPGRWPQGWLLQLQRGAKDPGQACSKGTGTPPMCE